MFLCVSREIDDDDDDDDDESVLPLQAPAAPRW